MARLLEEEGTEEGLVEDPPHLARDGGLVVPGHRPELDQARALRDAQRDIEYRTRTLGQPDGDKR